MIIVKGRLAAIDTAENLAKRIGEAKSALSLEEIFLKFVERESEHEEDDHSL